MNAIIALPLPRPKREAAARQLALPFASSVGAKRRRAMFDFVPWVRRELGAHEYRACVRVLLQFDYVIVGGRVARRRRRGLRRAA